MVRLPLSICLVMSVDAVKTVAHLIGAKIMAFVARCEKVTKCKTICVFDGFSPVSKAEEAAARKIRRDKALKAVKTILESPVKIEPRRKKTHKVSLLSRKAKQAIRFSDLRDEIVSFLRDANVAVSLEPEEADYKIAAMALETPTIILSTRAMDLLPSLSWIRSWNWSNLGNVLREKRCDQRNLWKHGGATNS